MVNVVPPPPNMWGSLVALLKKLKYVTMSAKVCINLLPSSSLLCPCRCPVMMAPSGAVLLSHTAQNSPSTQRVLAHS